MKNILIFLTFISVLFIFSSCEGAYDFDPEKLSTNVDLNPEIAIPLINASITLEELIPESDDIDNFLEIDNDNFMTLKYKFDVTDVAIGDFLGDDVIGAGLLVPKITYTIPPQSMELGLDKLLNQGSIRIADPRITVIIKNYWPIPVQFQFVDFYYYDDETAENKHEFKGKGDFADLLTVVQGPTEASVYGEYKETEIELNNITTNIDELISALPHHISFGAVFETNAPDGYTLPFDIPSNSVDSVEMEMEIPLDLALENIVMQDTIDADFGDIDSTLVESVTLKIVFNNGFPLSLNSQIYFLDNNDVVIDSLFTTGLNIEAGTVDANGKVDQSTSTTSIVETNEKRILNILKASKLNYQISINTTDASSGQNVKLYSDYTIGLMLGIKAKLSPEL